MKNLIYLNISAAGCRIFPSNIGAQPPFIPHLFCSKKVRDSRGRSPHAARSASLKMFSGNTCSRPRINSKLPNLAFTLIEILVVVSIIMIIATIGIGAYGSAKRNIVIDLEADKIVAALHSLRDSSRATALCEGIRFSEGKIPQKITAKYKNAIQGCAEIEIGRNMGFSSEINISSSSLDVFFEPPQGNMRLFPDSESAEIILILKNRPDISRKISVNKVSGKIDKFPPLSGAGMTQLYEIKF